MSIPGTWALAWARSGAAGTDLVGKKYDVAYYAPAGTTLATAEAAVPYGTYYTGQSGVWGSRLRAVGVQPDRKTKEVLATYHYQPPTVEDILTLDTSLVNVGARSVQQITRPIVDLNGNYVWHEERDPSGGPSYKWEPVAGTGIRFDRRMQFRTRFARDYGMGSNLLYYQDTVNGATMQQYWMCPTGSLLLAGWAKRRAPTTEKLWIYDCLIEYNPKKWNEETEVQKYEYRAFKIKLRDADGVLLDPVEYRIVSDWFPTDATYNAEYYPSRQWPLILGQFDW